MSNLSLPIPSEDTLKKFLELTPSASNFQDVSHGTQESTQPSLRIEELWNLTAGAIEGYNTSCLDDAEKVIANLLVLDDHCSLFAHSQGSAEDRSKQQSAWMRMAFVKNDDGTYQALLLERGRLVCETKMCGTPYKAAMEIFDYTSYQVGQALAGSRQRLRDGVDRDQTVLHVKKEASMESDQTTQTSQEMEVQLKRKPWGSLTRGTFKCEEGLNLRMA